MAGPKAASEWTPNPVGDIPASFTWGNFNQTNFLGTTKNQHLPQFCNSSWAFATTSALSDRIAVARGGVFPEIDLSPQLLLTCDSVDQGCRGGSALSAYTWMSQNNITDSSCAPYQAKSWKEGLQCNAQAICKECNPNGQCYVPSFFNNYRVNQYGSLPANNVQALQNEILANGPIVCDIDAGPIINFQGTGIVSNPGTATNHSVSVVGWGVSTDGQNTPYWIVRNSWGEYWGDNGYFKVLRGSNALLIESKCIYATPVNTWSKQVYPHTAKPSAPSAKANNINTFKELFKAMIQDKAPRMHKNCVQPTPKDAMQVIKSKLPHEMPMALPQSFWWGNVDGKNYLSWTVNQHLPQYCGSCWAQGGSSSIADRANILSGMTFPRIALAPQVLINCGVGSCSNGGNTNAPFEFAYKHGIPEMGCQVYQALDPPHASCTPIQQCANCAWNPDFTQNCWAVSSFTRWYVSEFGAVRGPDKMKKEIFARGPISCQLMATNALEKYTGGVFKEKTLFPVPNHVIAVTGWGVEQSSGEEYWIVRNSWGTHYGENGYFRIKMGSENLGIDSYDCWWGTPVAKSSVEAEKLNKE